MKVCLLPLRFNCRHLCGERVWKELHEIDQWVVWKWKFRILLFQILLLLKYKINNHFFYFTRNSIIKYELERSYILLNLGFTKAETLLVFNMEIIALYSSLYFSIIKMINGKFSLSENNFYLYLFLLWDIFFIFIMIYTLYIY